MRFPFYTPSKAGIVTCMVMFGGIEVVIHAIEATTRDIQWYSVTQGLYLHNAEYEPTGKAMLTSYR